MRSSFSFAICFFLVFLYWISPTTANITPNNDFYTIGLQESTDKVVDHQYGLLYDSILTSFRRLRRVKMMEIGLGCHMPYGPGHSVHVWQKYFDTVETFELWIAEFDVACAQHWYALYMSDPNIPDKHKKNLHLIFGDQADHTVLDRWITMTNATEIPFDIIVDDGGHTWKQQTNSFRGLWPAIVPGGAYFLEDVSANFLAWYIDDIPENRPFSWIMQVLERMMTRELYTPRQPQLVEKIRALHCQTGMCVFEKCALHEDGIHGQRCS